MNSIALSVNTEKLNEKNESKKSIALSMDTSKLNDLATQRTVALSVNPNKILKCLQEQNKIIQESPEIILEEESKDDVKSKHADKSKRSIGLSISSNMGASKEKSLNLGNLEHEDEKKEETEEKNNFKPFVVRKDMALSVITHTPTHKEGPNSIALSAITHTPTESSEKSNKQSINLSALHLSQNDYQEASEKSFRSAALSAVRVYEPKNYQPAPRNRDQSIEQSQNYQTDKSISAMNKSIHEIAIGKSDIEGVADLIRDNKLIGPKSIYMTEKSIDPKSYYMTEKSNDPKSHEMTEKSINPKSHDMIEKSLDPKSHDMTEKSLNPKSHDMTEKSINPKSHDMTEKSLNPKTVNLTEKSIGPKTIHLTEKSIGPITDNKEDKSIKPRSFLESREEEKYPRDQRRKKYPKNYESNKYLRNRQSSKRRHHSRKARLVDHQCQVVQGRDMSETDSSLIIRKNAKNDPYLRDQYTNAYMQDTGNQYREDYRTISGTGSEDFNKKKRLQVSEDLTIQLNFKGGKSSDTYSTNNSKMDKQI